MADPSHPPPPRRRAQRGRIVLARVCVAWALAAALFLAASSPGGRAFADEPMSPQAAVLVEQAIALITNEAPPTRVRAQIDDALNAPDKTGVNLAEVREARDLVAATGPSPTGMRRARVLLLSSLGGHLPSAPEAGQPATGNETGTSVILDEFRPTHGISDGGDAVLFALGLVAITAGVWLSRRLRPPHSLRQLEHRGAWKDKP